MLNIFLKPEIGLIWLRSILIASVASLNRELNKDGIAPDKKVTKSIGKTISKNNVDITSI